jgi:hypothetical protein
VCPHFSERSTLIMSCISPSAKSQARSTTVVRLLRCLRACIRRNRQVIKAAKETIKNQSHSIAQLQTELSDLKNERAKEPVHQIGPKWLQVLCCLLSTQAKVSFRAIPRILKVFQTVGLLDPEVKIPCSNSVTNWCLRIALRKYSQVQRITGPFGLLLDHSMDDGAQKVFLILRFSLSSSQDQGQALRKDQMEVVGFVICQHSTGQDVHRQLKGLIGRIGIPSIILSDEGPDLRAGIRLLRQEYPQIEGISDMTHKFSNLLKREFKEHPQLKALIQKAHKGSSAIRLGCWSFLKAPKINSHLRFLNVGRFVNWAHKLMEYMRVAGSAPQGSALAVLRAKFSGLLQFRPFLCRLHAIFEVINCIQKRLKTQGFSKETLSASLEDLQALPNSSLVRGIREYFEQLQASLSRLKLDCIPASTDVLESLFGDIKSMMERGRPKSWNRSVLLLNLLVGPQEPKVYHQALQEVSHNQLSAWVKENIPKTQEQIANAFHRAFLDDPEILKKVTF